MAGVTSGVFDQPDSNSPFLRKSQNFFFFKKPPEKAVDPTEGDYGDRSNWLEVFGGVIGTNDVFHSPVDPRFLEGQSLGHPGSKPPKSPEMMAFILGVQPAKPLFWPRSTESAQRC